MRAPDFATRIAEHLPLAPVPGLEPIVMHLAQPGSRLGRLIGASAPTPYWAYVWSGGAALAHFLRDRPASVAGRKVFDLGTGGGIVAIAAALAGASKVVAADIDPLALVALRLNAAANDVTIDAVATDPTGGLPDADIVLAGDVFYDGDAARRSILFLDRCLGAGMEVLVGDPRRRFLPLDRLTLLAEYEMRDVGQPEGTTVTGGVFAFGEPARVQAH